MFDIYLACIVAGLAIGILSPDALSQKGSDQLFSLAVIFAWAFVESIFLSIAGNTPGKWLFKTRIVPPHGGKLNYSTALSRSFKVWWRGLGIGFPLASLITLIVAHGNLTRNSVTSWDRDDGFTVVHERIGALRIIVAIAFFTGFLLLSIAGNAVNTVSGQTSKSGSKQVTSLVEATSRQAEPTDGFERLTLSGGLQVDVPLQWEPLPEELTTAIRTTANALMSNEGLDIGSEGSRLLLAYTSRPTTTYASIRIKEFVPASVPPAELLAASDTEVAAVAQELVQLMAKPMAKQKQDLQPGATTTRELVSGHPALVFRYRRMGDGGIVAVEQIKIMTPSRVVSVTLSYREAEGLLWRPVIENIRRSIMIPT